MSENRKGNISIHAQNIMPVIKRWLYSDQDIFIRELVANGCDAVTKFRMTGTPVEEELKVTVTVDKDAGELRFEDNGIGMSADEVEKYINQGAFSGAEEFLKNYQGNEDGGIIGHFGLGFYSAFMPADKVTIDTQSWQANEAAVRWESADGMAYEMSESKKAGRGTVITLHINEESKEFLEGYRVREVLDRYCGYMAVPIYLVDVKEEALKAEEAAKKAAEAKDGEEVKEPAAPAPINNTHPLWLKAPKDCTEDEYKDAYRKLFNTFEEPLFWIHLNVDYPFNLKGILYFPRIRKDFGGQEGQIKLFNRQVFVADNIKEIIPEFLLLLRGVLDCPDLPLNVSRSFLQNDGYVKKLSAHITKKVADKLNALMNTEREKYQTYWDDIHPFVKYGCLRDSKFDESVKGSILLKTTAGEYYTLDEYRSRNEGKAGKKVYYTTDAARQAASVALYVNRGIDVAVMDSMIDISFMQQLENREGADGLSFARVDADVEGLKDEENAGEEIELAPLETLFREAVGDDKLTVKLQPLADDTLPLMLLEDEQMRRYREMSAMYGNGFKLPERPEVVLNSRCAAVKALSGMEDEELKKTLARHYFDIARMASRPLENDELSAFIRDSYALAARLSK